MDENQYKEELIKLGLIIFLLIAFVIIGLVVYFQMINPSDPVVTEVLKNGCYVEEAGNCIIR